MVGRDDDHDRSEPPLRHTPTDQAPITYVYIHNTTTGHLRDVRPEGFGHQDVQDEQQMKGRRCCGRFLVAAAGNGGGRKRRLIGWRFVYIKTVGGGGGGGSGGERGKSGAAWRFVGAMGGGGGGRV